MATVERSIDVSGNAQDGFFGVSMPGGDMQQRAKAMIIRRSVSLELQMTPAERDAARAAIQAGQPVTILVTLTKV